MAVGPSRHDGAPQNTLSAINEMVRLYNEQFGRGPTKTRTNWAGCDVLVVTLEETFTPADAACGGLQPSVLLNRMRRAAYPMSQRAWAATGHAEEQRQADAALRAVER